MPVRSAVESSVIPPPVGGWNTRDPISAMDPTYSPEIENWFPKQGTVDRRGGTDIFASLAGVGFGIASYRALLSGLTSEKLVVAVSDDLYNITSGTPSLLGTNAGGGTFKIFQQYGTRLFFKGLSATVGVDFIYYWDGTTFNIADISLETSPGSGAYTLSDYNIGSMTPYKYRLFLGHRNRLRIYYTGENVTGIGVSANAFDIESLSKLGGYVAFIGSITRAKDYSEDELFCIISSEGEVFLYQGTSPASSTWAIIGHYFMPKPLGRRAFFYMGSTLMIITRQGVYPIESVMGGNFSGPNAAVLTGDISEIIRSAFLDAATDSLLDDERWVGINYPRGNFLLINVPTSSTTAHQYVMNTTTGAWTKFSSQNAHSWALFGDRLYYTDLVNAVVLLADEGVVNENPASPGNNITITTKLRHAFNYFGDVRNIKQFTDARPIINASNGLTIKSGMDVDYSDTTSTSTFTDTSDSSYKLYQHKLGLTGIGKAGSYRIDDISVGRVSLQATEIFFNKGDVA